MFNLTQDPKTGKMLWRLNFLAWDFGWTISADFARVLREGTVHSKRPIPYTARAALKPRHTQNAEGERNAEKRDSSMQSHSQQWLSLILNVLRRNLSLMRMCTGINYRNY